MFNFIIKRFIYFIIFPSFLFAQKTAEKLDQYLKAAEDTWKFSGCVLVSKKGSILLSKGYGMANHEQKIPNTPRTIYAIQSLNELFISTAILQLEEKKLLDLHKPITTYLSDYPKRTGNLITIHHLLTHSSGISDHIKNIDSTQNLKDVIFSFCNKPLEFRPGSSYKYSSANYILLEAIISSVTEDDFTSYLEKEILLPLHMFSTGNDQSQINRAKKAYGYIFNEKNECINTYSLNSTLVSGGYFSSTEDLYLWEQGIQKASILSNNSINKFFNSGIKNIGYGWNIQKTFGKSSAIHMEKSKGFQSFFLKFIKEGYSIIILCNNENVPIEIIGNSIAAILFNEPNEIPSKETASLSNYQKYVGIYSLTTQHELNISLNKNKLYLTIDNDKKIPLRPIASKKNAFISDDIVDFKIVFHSDGTNETSYLVLFDKDRKHFFKKMYDEIAVDYR